MPERYEINTEHIAILCVDDDGRPMNGVRPYYFMPWDHNWDAPCRYDAAPY